MTKRPVTNIAASVSARLKTNANSTGRPFQEVLQYFAMERFLYRLSQSTYRDKLVLKGSLMFTVWSAPTSRPTRDIDLLAHMPNDVESVVAVIRTICRQAVASDGLLFPVQHVQGLVIKDDANYEGVRVTFRAELQNARIPMQVDLGFGDVIEPQAALADYPTILEFAAPQLYGYPRETLVAEKFEAMVKLGLLNSRLKDFFDLWLVSSQFEFDGITLARAIERTFANRGTVLAKDPATFLSAFAEGAGKQSQWKAFLSKSKIDGAPQQLSDVTETITAFLKPLTMAVSIGQSFASTWPPTGPWEPIA